MSYKRVTRCLTWGEEQRRGSPIFDNLGKRIGFIDFSQWVTLCGISDEDPKEACAVNLTSKRPNGICPKCWSILKQFHYNTLSENFHNA